MNKLFRISLLLVTFFLSAFGYSQTQDSIYIKYNTGLLNRMGSIGFNMYFDGRLKLIAYKKISGYFLFF